MKLNENCTKEHKVRKFKATSAATRPLLLRMERPANDLNCRGSNGSSRAIRLWWFLASSAFLEVLPSRLRSSTLFKMNEKDVEIWGGVLWRESQHPKGEKICMATKWRMDDNIHNWWNRPFWCSYQRCEKAIWWKVRPSSTLRRVRVSIRQAALDGVLIVCRDKPIAWKIMPGWIVKPWHTTVLYSQNTHTSKVEPLWKGSEAAKWLEIDMKNGLQTTGPTWK